MPSPTHTCHNFISVQCFPFMVVFFVSPRLKFMPFLIRMPRLLSLTQTLCPDFLFFSDNTKMLDCSLQICKKIIAYLQIYS